MSKGTGYIFKVIYGQKSYIDYNEVIKKVHYWYKDSISGRYEEKESNTHEFAKGIINNDYDAYACKNCEISPRKRTDCIEVIGYRQKADGECWIRTSPDDSTTNNFGFLEYAKKIGIAQKE